MGQRGNSKNKSSTMMTEGAEEQNLQFPKNKKS